MLEKLWWPKFNEADNISHAFYKIFQKYFDKYVKYQSIQIKENEKLQN